MAWQRTAVYETHSRHTEGVFLTKGFIYFYFIAPAYIQVSRTGKCDGQVEEDLQNPTLKEFQPEVRVAGKKGKGTIAMVTACSPNMRDTADLSVKINTAYAKPRGYSFYEYTDVMVPRRMVTWNKVQVLLKMLEGNGEVMEAHERIMWVDTDAVVTNFSISLESIIAEQPGKSLLLCDDIGGWALNTGVMLWRNDEWSRETLRELWDMEHIPHMRGAEQQQLINLLERKDKEKRHHWIFPEQKFNTHPRVHNDTLFMIHMMGMSGDARIRKFEEYISKMEDAK